MSVLGNIKEKRIINFHSCYTISGSCAGVYGRPECVSSTRVAHVTFNDSGEGLLSITSRENRDGTLQDKWSHSSTFC